MRPILISVALFCHLFMFTEAEVMAAGGSRSFHETSIRKKIYSTPCDKYIKVRATKAGSFRVTRNN